MSALLPKTDIARPCRQPEPAGRQPHGCEQFERGTGAKAIRAGARVGPYGNHHRAARQPDQFNAEAILRDHQVAARTFGLQLPVVLASTEREIDTAFANLDQLRAGALAIGGDPYFVSRSDQLAALAVRYAMPAIFEYREFAAAGGLMSYGGSVTDAYRQVGVYTGRILTGEKPADLPIQQSTKAELIINLKAAKTLSLTIPPGLLARADEVIE